MDKKMLEKLENKAFAEEIMSKADPKEVKAAFAKEGIEISDEEIAELGKFLKGAINDLKDMPDAKLEEVSGGWGLEDYYRNYGRGAAPKGPDEFDAALGEKKISETTDEDLKILNKYADAKLKREEWDAKAGWINNNAKGLNYATVAAGVVMIAGLAYGGKKLYDYASRNWLNKT